MGATDKKILILNASPDKNSLISTLAKEYLKGCEESTFNYQYINLFDLDIDWIMQKKYLDKQNWEPEIAKQQQLIKWCTHLVIFTPNYWWNMPALLKGYFERVFTYGFASDYKDTFPYVIPLLKGRSARVIYTQNTTLFIGWIGRGDRFWKNINKSILRHCGFRPTCRTAFGPVNKSSLKQRNQWLKKVHQLGKNGK